MPKNEDLEKAEGRGTNVGAVELAEEDEGEATDERGARERAQTDGYEGSRNTDNFEGIEGSEQLAQGQGAQAYEAGEGNSAGMGGQVGDVRYQPGGNPAGERGRQEGMVVDTHGEGVVSDKFAGNDETAVRLDEDADAGQRERHTKR